MSYELVVFDWDGTLMDSTRVIAASPQSACRDIGIAVPSLIFYRHFRHQVDSLTVEMEEQATKLVDILHGERMDYPGQPQRA